MGAISETYTDAGTSIKKIPLYPNHRAKGSHIIVSEWDLIECHYFFQQMPSGVVDWNNLFGLLPPVISCNRVSINNRFTEPSIYLRQRTEQRQTKQSSKQSRWSD